MATPGSLNLFGGFQDHLGPPGDLLRGELLGSEFGLHSLSQEQKELFRQFTAHAEQDREAHARMHSYEAAQHEQFRSCSATGTPTHGGLLAQGQSLSPPPQPIQQPSTSQTGYVSHSVPHTPLKPFDSGMAGLSALSTPTISTGSLSLAGPSGMHHGSAIDASSALHSSSPMTPRQMLANADHMMLMPPASMLTVHAPPPGQALAGQVPPPPPPPSTPNALLSMVGGSGGGGGSAGSGGGQGQLTMAFANALAQAAVERGVDPSTLVQLLQSPKLVDVLLSKAGDLQQQQQQGMPMQPPPPPPPPKQSQLQSRMSAPVPGEWSPHHSSSGSGMGHFRPPPPPPPRPSPAATAAAQAAAAAAAVSPYGGSGPSGGNGAGAGCSAGSGGSVSGGGSGSSSGSLDNVPSMQQMLSSTLVQEFVSARGVLVQLMLSAYAFLNSDSMRDFYDRLLPVAMLYDEMHELPVVQKRKRCMEMSYLRMQLMNDPAFTQILQAVCALRHHLHSLSRKVLVMNQGPDGIPIDLLLGSMSTELFHVMKAVLPQEVCDYFGNCLPHPRLAVLVFAEFTSVDPMPTLA